MGFTFGLILGLLVGWIIELLIDWRFWRQDSTQPVTGQAEDKAGAEQATQEEITQYQHRLTEAEKEIERLQAELAAGTAQPQQKDRKKADRLERISGIGKVFKERFNEADIYTFAELASLTPERIREITQVEEWQKIEPEDWIAQAAELAKESEE